MRKPPGRLKRALAKKLQEEFPDCNGLALTWSAEEIYDVQGWCRSSRSNFNDTYRWSAVGRFKDTGNACSTIDCFATITFVLKQEKIADWLD